MRCEFYAKDGEIACTPNAIELEKRRTTQESEDDNDEHVKRGYWKTK